MGGSCPIGMFVYFSRSLSIGVKPWGSHLRASQILQVLAQALMPLQNKLRPPHEGKQYGTPVPRRRRLPPKMRTVPQQHKFAQTAFCCVSAFVAYSKRGSCFERGPNISTNLSSSNSALQLITCEVRNLRVSHSMHIIRQVLSFEAQTWLKKYKSCG